MQSQQCRQLAKNMTEEQSKSKVSMQVCGHEFQETTFVIKGVPSHLTQWQLLDLLQCLAPRQEWRFNLFYCPWNHEKGCNRGSAIINFTNKDHAVMFQHKWDTVKLLDRTEPLSLRLSAVQGFRANINYYKKTEMNNSGRDCPIYRDELGCLLPFCWDANATLSCSPEQPEEEPEVSIQGLMTFDELALLAMLGRNATCKTQ
eukprot:TRINITY_DN11903_c0_g1_i1.p1 TRINITY_DN11903_c0_g1~~TRINITY_DN11903_c0_g1_i1.p1  ORF type:complete len:202 (+),score=36.13 TRINITY_DN11903_c0_g1_i1:107-712(+)